MRGGANSKLIVIGAALTLCLPAFVIAAGVFCYFAPRQYLGKCTVEFSGSSKSDFVQAFGSAARDYRSAAELREVRNTGMFEICVRDANPQQAANNANRIAITIQDKMKDVALPGTISSAPPFAAVQMQVRGRPVRIWEKAEPAAYPDRPFVPAIMFIAVSGGLVFAAFGVVLLIVGFASRSDRVSHLRQAL